jgi:arylsulfatase A-like enzyme
MQLRFIVFVALFFALAVSSFASGDRRKAEHVVVIVWDGMRPDFVAPEHAPTLAAFARSGVFFQNNHSAFPSSTNVNGAAIATGCDPHRTGIISNQEFRPEINPHKAFDTSDFPQLDAADGRISETFLSVATLGGILQKAGFRTAIAGSKPVAQLFDPPRRRKSQAARNSVVLYRGNFLPKSAEKLVTAAIGPYPKQQGFPRNEENVWTTRALTEVLWKESVPKFSLIWLSEPDLSQHETAPGSPTSLAAIKNCDDNLASVLAALRARNALTSTDIFVVSDHGFSTINLALDAAERLRKAGFDAVREINGAPKPGRVLVVSLGGSMGFYVTEHDMETVRKLVDFLQHSDFAGVILTRTAQEGTFTLAQARLDTPAAPDVLVASRWSDRPNEFGVLGQVASDIGRNVGQGTHSTFSRFDMHNTLVAGGPDFRHGWTDETPTGNIDLAPTILWILGVKTPDPMDGRILREALADAREQPVVVEKTMEAQRSLGDLIWRQHLRTATVDGATYFAEGNGGSTLTQP